MFSTSILFPLSFSMFISLLTLHSLFHNLSLRHRYLYFCQLIYVSPHDTLTIFPFIIMDDYTLLNVQ